MKFNERKKFIEKINDLHLSALMHRPRYSYGELRNIRKVHIKLSMLSCKSFWDTYFHDAITKEQFVKVLAYYTKESTTQIERVFDTLLPRQETINYEDFYTFYSMFGPGVDMVKKALDLLEECKRYNCPLFYCSKGELPSCNPKCYFNIICPNRLVIYDLYGRRHYVYNNPILLYQLPYLNDETGECYSSWKDYFDHHNPLKA